MGPSGGTVCFETSGNKWDRKYQDWYCGNSPQCRDILLSTLTLNYLLFWWPQFLQSQPDILRVHRAPYMLHHHTSHLHSHRKIPNSLPVNSWAGLASHRSYHRRSLSFIAKTLLYFFGPEFPNNPVILGPGYFSLNKKLYFDRIKRVNFELLSSLMIYYHG